MSHPLGYYTNFTVKDAGTPLDILEKKFGAYLELLTRPDKYAFLATLSQYMAVHACLGGQYRLIEAFENVGCQLNPQLVKMFDDLETLSSTDIIGLCQALIDQIRHPNH